jgi:hypothetical protein
VFDLVYFAKLFEALEDEEDFFPFFEVDSLEEKELFGLILDFEVDDIDREGKELHFKLLVLGFEEFFSFLLVFKDFSENDFLVFGKGAIGPLVNLGETGGKLI